MSKEQELKKWENKFKLWMVLHPNYTFKNSWRLCIDCPLLKITSSSTGHYVCNDMLAKGIKLLHVNRTGKASLRSKINHIDFWCIEWIKHV